MPERPRMSRAELRGDPAAVGLENQNAATASGGGADAEVLSVTSQKCRAAETRRLQRLDSLMICPPGFAAQPGVGRGGSRPAGAFTAGARCKLQ
jgi:hypothetical protein